MRFAKEWRVIRGTKFKRMYLVYFRAIFFSLAALLIVAMLTIFAYSQDSLRRKLDTIYRQELEKAEAVVEMTISDTFTLLSRFSADKNIFKLLRMDKPARMNFAQIELTQHVVQALSSAKRISLDETVVLYSQKNQYVYSSRSGAQAKSFYSDAQLIEAYASGAHARALLARYAQGEALTAEESKWYLTAYQPLATLSRFEDDFVAINIDLSRMLGLLGKEDSSDSASELFAAQDGAMLLATRPERQGESLAELFGEAAAEMAGESSGALTARLDREPVRVLWKRSEYGITYALAIPLAEYALDIAMLLRFALCSGLCALGLALLFSYFVSMRLFRPVASIMSLLETPDDGEAFLGDTRYMLMDIVNAWQKNTYTEDEVIRQFADMKAARLRVLQDQIKPHFLYNALQSIRWLAVEEKGEEGKVSQALDTLASLSRDAMDNGMNQIPLRDEVSYIRRYVEMQRLRHGDGLRLAIQVPEALDERPILKMSLEPLVENAIVHGALRSRGALLVTVRVEGAPDGPMRACVEDDGPGMDEAALANWRAALSREYVSGGHAGLLNLNKRLTMIYGTSGGLRLSRGAAGGLRVEFAVPWEENVAYAQLFTR